MNRANQLSSDRICGILFQYNECSINKNHISFEIELNPSHRHQVNISRNKISHPDCMERTTTFSIKHSNLIDSNSYCFPNNNGKSSESNYITKISTTNPTMASLSPLIIAQLSDFHYDQHYAGGSSSDCQDFICCRNASIVSRTFYHSPSIYQF